MATSKTQHQAVLLAIDGLTERKPNTLISFQSIHSIIQDHRFKIRITPEELPDVLYALESKGLIEGTRASGDFWISVKLTNKGRSFLDDGNSLTDEPKEPFVNQNNYFNGNNSNVQVGNGNTQNVQSVQNIQVGVNEEYLPQLIEALREDGHGELATEVEQATGKHGIRALGGYLGKILDKVVLAGAGSATAAAIPLIFPA